MKAIILAAGRGSRMKSLTDEQPKCLVKVKDKTLLEWQLDAIIGAGIKDIAIVTGYKRELLTQFRLREFYNQQWSTTNMVSSLACAEEWLLDSPCIVSYSDIFYSSEAITSLINSNSILAVTYDPNWLQLWTNRFGDPLLDAETFRISSKNTLIEIGNKPKSIDEIEGQYMGLLKFTPLSWKEMQGIRSTLTSQQRDKMHMTGTLQKIIEEEKIQIEAIQYKGLWGEVDTSEDLLHYKFDF
jgi:choline kinase